MPAESWAVQSGAQRRKPAPRPKRAWPSCHATRRHCQATATLHMLCTQAIPGSTTRIVRCTRLNVAHGRAERALDSGPRSRSVTLHLLRYLDALYHGCMRLPSVPQHMRERDRGRIIQWVQFVSCGFASSMQALRQARRHPGNGTAATAFRGDLP